jgi:hypothetical protein
MYNVIAENSGYRAGYAWCRTAPQIEACKRKRMDEESRKTHQELWEQYMEVERRELEQRRSGQLGRALGLALPGESQEELQRIAEEDQRKAERGLVELRSGDEVWYKHIDKLTRDDRPARIESENARAAWIQERLRRQPHPQ